MFIALAIGGWLYWQNQELKAYDAPRGLMSLQLAANPEAAKRVIQSWTPDQRALARKNLAVDFLLIAAYGFAMYGACRAAAPMLSAGPRDFAVRVVAPMQLAAALLDAVENLGQLWMIHGVDNHVPELTWLSIPIALCAALKWLFLFFGIATVLTGLASRALGSSPAIAVAAGLKPPTADFARMLDEELDGVDAARKAVGRSVPVPKPGDDARKRAEGASLAGLAFSGGGIRSATANLGVLQSFANHSLLRRFDYLSTVSGGGYIGSWLAAWSNREPRGIAGVEDRLRSDGACAPQVEFLRTYSNYLTPRKGFFTVDTWAAVATYVRNLMLNLSIFVLLVWAALALVVFLASYGLRNALPLGVAALLLLWFAVGTATIGVTVRVTDLDRLTGYVRWAQTGAGVALGIVGSLFAAAVTGGFWIIGWAFDNADDMLTAAWVEIAVVGSIETWLICWFYGEQVNARNGLGGAAPRPNTVALFLGTVLIAGAIAVTLMAAFVLAVAEWNYEAWFVGAPKAAVALVLSPAIILGAVAAGIVFGIGLLGIDYSDKGREWWSRILGWLLALTLGWTLLVGGAFVIPGLIAWAGEQPGLSPNKILASLWAAVTLLLARIGKDTSGSGFLVHVKGALLTVGPYVVIAGFLVICTWTFFNVFTPLTVACQAGQSLVKCVNDGVVVWFYPGHGAALGAFILCLLLALILASRVDINRFSLHDFYKNRLVRCYLGASNPNRTKEVDRVSGFAETDDMRLASLHHVRPYPIVNTALNIVRGKRLAWQERQAASFVLTPRYCGFELPGPRSHDSFRETSVYAGGAVTLGGAMSVSGAAVNPQHGKGTTPVFMLFATLLNLRTGVWAPNSRYPIARASPTIAGGYLLAELFGWTDEEKQYVHLSDGGHFDNLGVYELVRRRCRLIVVIDATEDSARGFEDLASCIRRCEVDFGARIHIKVADLVPQANQLSDAAVARGEIEYAQLPGSAAFVGTILYVKSSRIAKTEEAAALYSYGRIDERFPHHSTVDQWFNESRFESYRALGRTLGEVLISQYSKELA